MLEIDGSAGEGGGQILRTALSLSTVTGRPFRIVNVRAGRSRPGLARQHLTAVRGAREVCDGRVDGAEPGSTRVVFRPGRVRPAEYRFSTGGAGSCTLVLQTVLWPLVTADGTSTVVVEGGTHNPFAPPFDFMAGAFLPLVSRMGARVELVLERPGFYPAGGGRIRARIGGAGAGRRGDDGHPGGDDARRREGRGLRPLVVDEPGEVRSLVGRAYLSALPGHVARRELDALAEGARELGLPAPGREVVEVDDPDGPGNAIVLELRRGRVTEIFTGFGRKGAPAEEVAAGVLEDLRAYLDTGAAVGAHLADQLLLPLALAGSGGFTTVEPTSHFRTNAEVVGRFLDVRVRAEPLAGGRWRVRVGNPDAPADVSDR